MFRYAENTALEIAVIVSFSDPSTNDDSGFPGHLWSQHTVFERSR